MWRAARVFVLFTISSIYRSILISGGREKFSGARSFGAGRRRLSSISERALVQIPRELRFTVN